MKRTLHLPKKYRSLPNFALSVIWRSSLCNWFCRGEIFQQIELGPYQENIRKYIKGEVGSLHRVEVGTELSELDPPWLAMSLPRAYRVDSGRCHRFHIPGITFVVAAGGSASAQNGSIPQSPRLIFVGRDGDKVAQAEMMRIMKGKPPRGYEIPLVSGTERIK